MPDLLFENVGGRFVERTKEAGIAGGGQGHSAIWWDFDEDGWPDLYVANDFEPADRLYRNNRDGTFTDVIGEVLVAAPYSAMGADIGDINSDGRIDFLVADMATRDHGKWHRTVGAIESKVIRAPTTTVPQFMKNMLSVKIGPNQFAEVGHLAGLEATDWTWAVRLADLDNDGLLDAYFTNGMVRAFHDGDLGLKSLQAKTGWQRMAHFKASPQYDERNLAFRNLGDFQFVDTSEEWGLDLLGVSFGAAFGDFDQDGDLDLVVSNLEKNLTLYRNHAGGGGRVVVQLQGTESNRYGVGAKVRLRAGGRTQVRELTLTRGYLSTDEPIVHFGLGEAAIIERMEIEWPSGRRQVLESLPINHRFTITEPVADSGAPLILARSQTLFEPATLEIPPETVSEEEYFQIFPRMLLIPTVETMRGPALSVADLDDDGRVDVVLGGSTGQATRVFRNVEGKKLQYVRNRSFESDYDAEDRDIHVSDFNGDGFLDLSVTSGSIELDEGDPYYRDRVYLGDGKLGFKRALAGLLPSKAEASEVSVLLDVDGDGDLDLVVGGGTRNDMYPKHYDNSVWLWNGEAFEQDLRSEFAQAFQKSGKTSDLVTVDLDGDGRLDLVQTVEWGSPVLWYCREGVFERSAAFGDGSLSGVWRCAAAGDFDGDGRMDLFLGNFGQNTTYRPSVGSPHVLFSPKEEELSETFFEGYTIEGQLYPAQNRMLLEVQFPKQLDMTSGSVSEFSTQTIEQAIPEHVLRRYDRYPIVEARSVLLLQKKGGEFVASPLPRFAQSGVVIDALAADINDDGTTDLVLVHEARPPNLWADRNLRGHLTLLLNDGTGRFEALLPWDSGLEVDGYPRRLAWADLDGDGGEELLVSMNKGPLLVFRRRGGE